MKYFKQNILLKVLSLNSFSVGVSFVLGLFSSKIISVFLGTPGMALLGSFRNFSGMLKAMATLGISNSVVKLVAEKKEDQKELSIIYSTFFWMFFAISIFLTIIVIAFANPISKLLFFKYSYSNPIRFFGLSLTFIVINTFWISIYNGFEKFKRIILIQIISNLAVFICTVSLIWKYKIEGGFYAIAVGEILMALITFLFIRNDKSFFNFDLKRIIDKRYFQIIKKFSMMSLLSAIVIPTTLILIRNLIVENNSLSDAGIWDAINRLSGFYMILFGSGLTMYYMPKLASLTTDKEFKTELKQYFKIIFPLFLLMLIVVYLARNIIIKIAFTNEFSSISDLFIWQLLGDLMRIATLAFGYQILVKTMLKKYFFIEICFNASYVLISFLLIKSEGIEGVLKAYLIANLVSLLIVLFFFRKLLTTESLSIK